MKKIKFYALLTALILTVIVLLQNRQPVETRFLFITITMPNAILLGLTLLVGIAVGVMLALILSNKRKDPKE